MSDVFYLRPITPPITPDDAAAMSQHAGGCFDLHRVDWLQSFLAKDGGRMLCWYRAPDAESVRLALRQLGADMNAAWPGTVTGDEVDASALSKTNVVAEFHFTDSHGEGPDAVIEACRGASRDANFVCAFMAANDTRMVALFEATDETVVTSALASAPLPPFAVWPCYPLTPSTPPPRHRAPP